MAQVTKQATGRRKTSVARAYLRSGSGAFEINGREPLTYLRRQVLVDMARRPLTATETAGKLDVILKVSGGGLTGQAGAISLALSRALANMEPELRTKLRQGGFLTRDPRAVERKKYGRPKARKRFQFSKR